MEHHQQILQTLLIVYIVILGINSAIAIKLYFSYKTKPFMALVGVWLFTLLNFILQGVFIQLGLGAVLAFATYAPTALCLIYIVRAVSNQPLNLMPLAGFFAAAMLVSCVLSVVTTSFTVTALPVALALGLPQLYYGGLKMFGPSGKESPEMTNIFAFILVLNGLHFLDYPFLRPHPEAALFGFGAVIIISCVISVLLPTIIGKHHSNILTAELNESMRESQRLAKTKSDFLANMSHEIKTPLNGIRGLTDMLRETPLNDPQSKYVDLLADASDSLLEIIENILSATQLDSGRIEVSLSDFALRGLLQEVEQYYTIRNDNRDIAIFYELGHCAHLSIHADRGKILQIIYNLINNALKYCGGTRIVLSLNVSHGPNGRQLTIAVSDDGRGIDEKNTDAIFDQFTQLSHKNDGVGLGLSIVKKLVEVLEGEITLTSQLGRGATFLCKIPFKETTSESRSHGTKDEPAAEIEKYTPSSVPDRHVLVVEDDPVTQMILEGYLKKWNFKTTLMDNAEDAIAHYQAGVYVMVLTDVALKGQLTGLDLVGEIRKQDLQIPIIVQSAFGFDKDIADALACGASDFIKKPTKMSALLALCQKYASAPVE